MCSSRLQISENSRRQNAVSNPLDVDLNSNHPLDFSVVSKLSMPWAWKIAEISKIPPGKPTSQYPPGKFVNTPVWTSNGIAHCLFCILFIYPFSFPQHDQMASTMGYIYRSMVFVFHMQTCQTYCQTSDIKWGLCDSKDQTSKNENYKNVIWQNYMAYGQEDGAFSTNNQFFSIS